MLAALSGGTARSYAEIWYSLGLDRPTPEVARALAHLERTGEVIVCGNGLGRTYRLTEKGRSA